MEKRQHTLMSLFGAYTKVEIPISRRDYAQGRKDVEMGRVELQDAIHGHLAADEPQSLDLIYGEVKDGVFQPIDGQQRLTTLVLLHWYAARREEVAETEWDFLRKFSYATRVSTRKFFEMLMGFTPAWGESKLSAQIKGQHWFAADWDNDPTINSALVMLDDIDNKFADLAAGERLWQGLTAKGLVSFFFLPIADGGKADNLYVEKISRGKPLTEFEHFKAKLESRLKEFDGAAAARIGRKIDTRWTRALWQVNNKHWHPPVDMAFVRYILFIANIVRRRKGETPIKDVFDALDVLFGDASDRDANVHLLESMFDIWCDVGDIQTFFEGVYSFARLRSAKTPVDPQTTFNGIYLYKENAEGKIKVFFHYDPLTYCCYEEERFSLGYQIWLYAVCVYLLNKGRIADGDRFRRLRTIRNLIGAGVYELEMRTVFAQIDKIVRDGVVEYAPNGFAKAQIEEEQAKWEYVDKHPEDAALVYKLEDHPLLRGRICVVGLDHLKLCDKFYALFNDGIDPLVRCRALLAHGDYSQIVDDNMGGWGWSKYQFATAGYTFVWSSLFYPPLSERTGNVLRGLLESLDTISDETLHGVVDRYLREAEEKALFDWRYYMVRYADCLMKDGAGYYAWLRRNEEPYVFFCLGWITFHGRHWLALLHILQSERSKTKDDTTFVSDLHLHRYRGVSMREIPLVLKKDGDERYSIRLRNDGYEVYDHLDNGQEKSIRYVHIEQKDGVDTRDRIEVGLKLIDELLSA